jgi:hypothetical protein
LSHRIECQGRNVVLIPDARPMAHAWQEWTDFQLKPAAVIEAFPKVESNIAEAAMSKIVTALLEPSLTIQQKEGNRPPAGATTKGPSSAARRGARVRYDWPAFDAEAWQILEYRGGFSPAHEVGWNQAALERLMADWCTREWRHVPSESTIRNRVSQVYNRFRT